MASIIIPAHNEENVIKRCLTHFHEGVHNQEYEVIIVCNGCTDNTANLVREMNGKIKVIETEVASKIHALNLGDKHASFHPRIYLDADVEITHRDLKKVIKTLNSGEYLAAAPKPNFVYNQASFLVSRFYKVWSNVPYFDNGMLGCGFYGLTEEGRKRFSHFPDIIADDEYIRLQYNGDERVTVKDASFNVFSPKTLSGLVKIKTRSHYGNKQLQALYPEIFKNENKKNENFLKTAIRNPSVLIHMPTYLLLKVYIHLRVRMKLRDGKYHETWERDETSRNIV
jgi:glycosyltransferase involved in cell wall biosynthesis